MLTIIYLIFYLSMKNFFRKDLNLSAKRRHRLLVVLFFGGYIVAIFLASKWTRPEYTLWWNIYKNQWSLEERLTSKVVSPKELLLPWEILEYPSYPVYIFIFITFQNTKYQSILNYNPSSYYLSSLDEVFCSDSLSQKIDEIMLKTNIHQIYKNSYLEEIQRDDLITYINDKNIKCVSINWFWWENKFLDLERGERYQSLHFYKQKKHNFFKIISNITNIFTLILIHTLLLLVPFWIVVIIYYKVILYVIYWKAKNTPNKKK